MRSGSICRRPMVFTSPLGSSTRSSMSISSRAFILAGTGFRVPIRVLASGR
ncbi:hypothetical protein RchiOBHm_Chr5g0081601 [Rosa chinensis]|uniref:Uncharacterized protein n=1 Tax=Rosa chinensis TaxID=74649 RepID=A0A2P6QN47_ROSCH|nr:hypothetical protein RchiOBHm_Chr5g0081601 [Rosa chinensis]